MRLQIFMAESAISERAMLSLSSDERLTYVLLRSGGSMPGVSSPKCGVTTALCLRSDSALITAQAGVPKVMHRQVCVTCSLYAGSADEVVKRVLFDGPHGCLTSSVMTSTLAEPACSSRRWTCGTTQTPA